MATGLVAIIVALWLVGHVGIISGRLAELVKGNVGAIAGVRTTGVGVVS